MVANLVIYYYFQNILIHETLKRGDVDCSVNK